ncbi:MAG: hypothetical protein TR69_WS6001000703 [candidate division WS6 bacterium OLB20]|uniref:Uncharacterized protein n=1 Tax=candidate division WS6 bacterium OLB20 TaxID=1617426 RepID=A0A136LYG6_9BACT|nr:MAG: hypothetical protein TR69_WS6001000703 [candidate division WS6 bacterium OLB20]
MLVIGTNREAAGVAVLILLFITTVLVKPDADA